MKVEEENPYPISKFNEQLATNKQKSSDELDHSVAL